MSVEETGVAYYGVMYPDRAVQDFEEMIEYGCNAVLLGWSEFDAWFWHPNVKKLIQEAKNHGLKVYVDPWAWGKIFGGEPTSVFLQNHADLRQISSKTGKSLPSACFNTPEFRQYMVKNIEKMAQETETDYFFWDEPHYASFWRVETGTIEILELDDWACACELCQKLFKDQYGYQMPTEMTDDVEQFRQDKIIEFLDEISQAVKKTDSKKGVCVCLLPMSHPLIGITNWEQVAILQNIDMLSTDPYWVAFSQYGLIPSGFQEGINWYKETLDNLIELAKRNHKKTQAWVQAFNIPNSREEEIVKGIEIAKEKKIDSIFAWPYRAGEGSILASDNAPTLWKMIGEAYKKARKTP